MDIYTIKELLLQAKPVSIHHLNEYIELIENALRNPTTEKYKENHHILPKSMFPEYASFKEHPWNKISLPAKQHYISHELLWQAFRNRSMAYAFWAMNIVSTKDQKRYMKISPELYEELRIERARFLSETNSGENNPFYGKTHSEEERIKSSIRNKELWANEEYRKLYTGTNHPMYGKKHKKSSVDKMIKTRTGKKHHSEEYKEKLSQKMTGSGNPMFNVKVSPEVKDKNSKYGYVVYKSNGRVDVTFRIRGEYCEMFSYNRGRVSSMIGNTDKTKSYKDIIRVERYDKDYFVNNILPFINPEFIDFSPESVGKI